MVYDNLTAHEMGAVHMRICAYVHDGNQIRRL
jgi:hypothetical protein